MVPGVIHHHFRSMLRAVDKAGEVAVSLEFARAWLGMADEAAEPNASR